MNKQELEIITERQKVVLPSELEQTGTVGKKNSGTTLRFWPNPKYFDSPTFSVSRLRSSSFIVVGTYRSGILWPSIKITVSAR